MKQIQYVEDLPSLLENRRFFRCLTQRLAVEELLSSVRIHPEALQDLLDLFDEQEGILLAFADKAVRRPSTVRRRVETMLYMLTGKYTNGSGLSKQLFSEREYPSYFTDRDKADFEMGLLTQHQPSKPKKLSKTEAELLKKSLRE